MEETSVFNTCLHVLHICFNSFIQLIGSFKSWSSLGPVYPLFGYFHPNAGYKKCWTGIKIRYKMIQKKVRGNCGHFDRRKAKYNFRGKNQYRVKTGILLFPGCHRDRDRLGINLMLTLMMCIVQSITYLCIWTILMNMTSFNISYYSLTNFDKVINSQNLNIWSISQPFPSLFLSSFGQFGHQCCLSSC